MAAEVTIFHNPACSTSRKVLVALRARGPEPTVVEYLKTGWRRDQLERLFRRMNVTPRQALRVRGGRAEELGLTEPWVTDDQILEAMTSEPVLVERPIVVTDKGAAIVRPPEKLAELM
ncbi:MAG TPA: arsenate reductase (glutaredoxin) [Caulobacteraceae bacterium]|nr:arsenate reductase (glutaredoxin) [Caulobacteraceae bacterium]